MWEQIVSSFHTFANSDAGEDFHRKVYNVAQKRMNKLTLFDIYFEINTGSPNVSYQTKIEIKKIFNEIKSGSTDKFDRLLNLKAYHELRYMIVNDLIDKDQLNFDMMREISHVSMILAILLIFKGYSLNLHNLLWNSLYSSSLDLLRKNYENNFVDLVIDNASMSPAALKLALLLQDEKKLQEIIDQDLIDFNMTLFDKSFFYHCCESLPSFAEKLLDEDQIDNFNGPVIEVLLDQDETDLALRVLPYVEYPKEKYYLILLALIGDVDKIEGLLDFDEEEKAILEALPIDYGKETNRQQLLSHWT